MRLQAKLTAYTILLLAILILVATYLGVRRETQGILIQMEKDGVALARSYALSAENAMMVRAGLGRITGEASRSRGIAYLKIVDKRYRVIGHTDVRQIDRYSHDPLITRALRSSVTVVDRGDSALTAISRAEKGEEVFRVVIPLVILNTVAGALEIGLDMDGISEALARTRQYALIVAVIALLLGSVLVWLFARSITQPITVLAEATRRVSAGDLDHEIRSTARDEIGLLANSFNEMTRNLRAFREMQRKIHETDKLASIGELSVGVAHEVRNPLGAIKTCAQFLEDKLHAEDGKRKFAQIIIREAERLNQLIEQLLNFARPTRADFQYTDVNALIEEVLVLVRLKADSLRIAIEGQYDEALPRIFADGKRLEQAFLNIMFNALDATPEGGRVLVETEFAPEAGRILISFSDTGEGIPPDKLDKVFTPFYTTRKSGTGLGLAIVQQIIAEHGGTIDVESEVGRGTKFTISLPIEHA